MLPCCSGNHRAGLGRWPHWPPRANRFANLYTCFVYRFVIAGRTSYAFASPILLQVLLEMLIIIFLL